jgi:hypothetical protein
MWERVSTNKGGYFRKVVGNYRAIIDKVEGGWRGRIMTTLVVKEAPNMTSQATISLFARYHTSITNTKTLLEEQLQAWVSGKKLEEYLAPKVLFVIEPQTLKSEFRAWMEVDEVGMTKIYNKLGL